MSKIPKISEVNKHYDEAFSLPETNKEESILKSNKMYAVLKEYKSIFWSKMTTSEDKVKVVILLIERFPDEGLEAFSSLRDGIVFLKNYQDKEKIEQMLVKICENPSVDADTVLRTGSHMYELSRFPVAYELFKLSAEKDDTTADIQAEACKYLYSSDKDNQKYSINLLCEIIATPEINENFRFNLVKDFTPSASNPGLRTKYRTKPLEVHYLPAIIWLFQEAYFYSDFENHYDQFEELRKQVQGLPDKIVPQELQKYIDEFTQLIRRKILVAQMLLQNSFYKGETREKWDQVITILFKWVQYNFDDLYPDRERRITADILDIILRNGDSDSQKEARKLLINLGNIQNLLSENPFDKIGLPIAKNTENIHMFDKAISEFYRKLKRDFELFKWKVEKAKKTNPNFENIIFSFDKIYSILEQNIASLNFEDYEDKEKAFVGLRRFKEDTAYFKINEEDEEYDEENSNHKITLSETLCYAWHSITYLQPKSAQEDLQKNLYSAFIDMGEEGGSCSSGHGGRVCEVFEGYGFVPSLDIFDELKDCISARLQKTIREEEDEETRDYIMGGVGITVNDSSDEDEKKSVEYYRKHLSENFPTIVDDLYNEYVISGIVSKKKFTRYLDEIKTMFAIIY